MPRSRLQMKPVGDLRRKRLRRLQNRTQLLEGEHGGALQARGKQPRIQEAEGRGLKTQRPRADALLRFHSSVYILIQGINGTVGFLYGREQRNERFHAVRQNRTAFWRQ